MKRGPKSTKVRNTETLDLSEPLVDRIDFEVPAGLDAAFSLWCLSNPLGKLNASEVLRRELVGLLKAQAQLEFFPKEDPAPGLNLGADALVRRAVRVQPSLKGCLVARCEKASGGPLDYRRVLLNIMHEVVRRKP